MKKTLTMSQSSYHSLLLVSVHHSIIQSYTRVGSQKFLPKAKTFGNCRNIFLHDGCSSYKLLRVVPIQLNNWPTREQARSDRDSATRLSPMSDSSLLRLNDSSCDMVCGILLRCNFIYVPNTHPPLVATIMMEWINNSVKLTTIHEVEHSRDNFWLSTSHKTLNFTSSLATIHHCQWSTWKYMITVSAQYANLQKKLQMLRLWMKANLLINSKDAKLFTRKTQVQRYASFFLWQ